MPDPVKVLFVCVSNRGKSVMAEYLTPMVTDRIRATSAGTEAKLGGQMNVLSAEVLAEVDVHVGDHRPQQLTDDLMRAVDLVVVVGAADVTAPDGVVVEIWRTDEPADRGIDGVDRMRLIRDEITTRIRALADRVTR